MGKNHSPAVVLWIPPIFWWMLPMVVRDNYTKYEPQSQRWWSGTGVASARPPFQNLQFSATITLSVFTKTTLEPAKWPNEGK